MSLRADPSGTKAVEPRAPGAAAAEAMPAQRGCERGLAHQLSRGSAHQPAGEGPGDVCARRYSIGRQMIASDHYAQTLSYLRLFVPLLAGCRRVIDLGCSEGTFLGLLGEAGVAAVGVELDPDLAADARARGFQVVCDNAIHYLATTHERFDGAFCSHVVEHLDYETVITLVENTWRLLEPGGIFVIVTPNPESLSSRVGFWRTLDHVRPYYRDALRTILRHYGFELCRGAPDGANWREGPPVLTHAGVPAGASWLRQTGLRKLRRTLLACIGAGYVARFLDAPHDSVVVVRKPAGI